MSVTIWVLLGIILFFSFLTFYSAYFNKVTDCGCFGDAIKLTPWQSFSKDIILLTLILIIFPNYHKLTPIFRSKIGDLVIGAVVVLNLGLAIYAIRHLPFIDFRAYKPGASIPASMESSEPLRHMYVMEKDGKEYEFEEYPTDTTYKYLSLELLNPEAQPTITDYSVWNVDGEDITEKTFEGNQLLVVIHYVEKVDFGAIAEINELINQLGNAFGIMVLTASDEESFEDFRHEVQLAAPYYFADATVLKTMVRSNPGLLFLKDGVVRGKWHFRDVPDSKLLQQLSY